MKTVFVSSTFKDMHKERDAIHESVSPNLNSIAREYGDGVAFCDLRWGVNTTELDSDDGSAKVLSVCLDEIDRCRPYMVVIIGERYGWIPNEKLISDCAATRGLSLDELEKSVTALEIEYGALSNPDNLDHILFYFREIVGRAPDMYLPESVLHEKKLAELKERIRKLTGGKVKEYQVRWNEETGELENTDTFAQMLLEDMKQLLLPEWEKDADKTLIEKEYALQLSLAYENEYPYSAREELVSKYLAAVEEQHFIVLAGASGCGKTALMSQLVGSLVDEDKRVLPLFCGSTVYSNTAFDVLQYLVECVECLLGLPCLRDMVKQPDYETWQNRLFEVLQIYKEQAQRDLYIVIDALDQLFPDEHLRNLDFLPSQVQGKIHVILSAVSEYEFARPIRKFQIPELTVEDRIAMMLGILKNQGRELAKPVIEVITRKSAAKSPLYLGFAIQRLIMMRKADFESITAGGDNMDAITNYQIQLIHAFPDDVQGACGALIDAAAERIGGEMVKRAVSYIAYSRHGLRKSDLESLFAKEKLTWSDLNFSMFVNYLRDFFVLREDGRYDFSHKSIRQGICDRTQDVAEYLQALFVYFRDLDEADPVRGQEIGYHAIMARQSEYLFEYVSSLMEAEQNMDRKIPQGNLLYIAKDIHDSRGESLEWLINVVGSLAQKEQGYDFVKFAIYHMSQVFSTAKEDGQTLYRLLETCMNLLENSDDKIWNITEKTKQICMMDTYVLLADTCMILSGEQMHLQAIDYNKKAVSVGRDLQLKNVEIGDRLQAACYKTCKALIQEGECEQGYLYATRGLELSANKESYALAQCYFAAADAAYMEAARYQFYEKKSIQNWLNTRTLKKYATEQIQNAISVYQKLCKDICEQEVLLGFAQTQMKYAEILELVNHKKNRDKVLEVYQECFRFVEQLNKPCDMAVQQLLRRCCNRLSGAIMDQYRFNRLSEADQYVNEALFISRFEVENLGNRNAYSDLSGDLAQKCLILLAYGREESYEQLVNLSAELRSIAEFLNKNYAGSGAEIALVLSQFVDGATKAVYGETNTEIMAGFRKIQESAASHKWVVKSYYVFLLKAWRTLK